MPKVSVNILTKNRAGFLPKALASVLSQSFLDYEVLIINDGSNDSTKEVLEEYKDARIKIISHQNSLGITVSRQEALEKSLGQYVAILDDDDEWVDINKLKKQVEYLDSHTDYVLVGGGMKIEVRGKMQEVKLRPESDEKIRRTMLLRNNFFTSTVMFRREAVVKAGGFINNGQDLAEDYDLWLRLGRIGQMYNFKEFFVNYHVPSYNKDKKRQFLLKQLRLARRDNGFYPLGWLAIIILKLRILF